MLFMGEEYGENAPFQFFSDHIDEKIATATREGRRREFAAFAQFGEAIPDPQAESTMLASKLTRDRDPQLAELYARLIAARKTLAPGVRAIEFDEPARWMRVLRGEHELMMNFAAEARLVPTEGDTVVLATHGAPSIGPEGVRLEPLSGALIA
jgi:maltooligosyltrehalose trehalohydrolase